MRSLVPVLLAGFAFGHASAEPIPFTFETVDPARTGGFSLDFELDAQGDPHFAFPGVPSGVTYLARHEGQWTRQAFVGSDASLALDRLGQPHLTYCIRRQGSGIPDTLYYATLDESGWRYESVDREQIRFLSSIALDSDDQPHVVHLKFTTGGFPNESDIQYSKRVDGAWQGVRLGVDFVQSGRVSLALDPSDQPHVSYPQQGGSLTLEVARYARPGSNGWTIESITTIDRRSLSSLRLDAAGVPHLILSAGGSVRHATRVTSGWEFETVAPQTAVLTALAFDADGNPHVSFASGDQLVYARRQAGAWESQVIASGVTVTNRTRIQMDGEGNPHIAFLVGGGVNELRHAVGRLHARARAFAVGGDRVLHLMDARPSLCLQIQPEAGSFELSEVNLGAITLTRDGGSGETLTATQAEIDLDRDRDGATEVRACFDKSELAELLGLESDGVAPLTLRGPLSGGGSFVAHVELTVDVGRGPTLQATRTGGVLSLSAEPGPVEVRIFDLAGRTLRKHSAVMTGPGAFSIDLEQAGSAERLAPGVYFYRVESVRGTRQGRFVVLR